MDTQLGFWRTIQYGAFVGAVAASLAVLSLCSGIAVLSHFEGNEPSASPVSLGGVLLVGAVAGIGIALIPSTVGGAIVALILRGLWSQQKLSTGSGILTGALVGATVGVGTTLVVLLIGGRSWSGLDIIHEVGTLAVSVGGIAAAAGGWHGWILVRWLRKPRH